jgi:predicted DCC family thiol-disulfide oxidoreductase YuxK
MCLNEMETRDPPASQGTAPVAPATQTVWFDGGCPLCRRASVLFRRAGRRGASRFEGICTQKSAHL